MAWKSRQNRYAYETCSNCRHSNRPFGDEQAHKKFDWKKLRCSKSNRPVPDERWCEDFEVSPVIAAASLTGALQTIGMPLEVGQFGEAGHQSEIESQAQGSTE